MTTLTKAKNALLQRLIDEAHRSHRNAQAATRMCIAAGNAQDAMLGMVHHIRLSHSAAVALQNMHTAWGALDIMRAQGFLREQAWADLRTAYQTLYVDVCYEIDQRENGGAK